ncbi:hypothetical protein CAQU_11215 [Corynebacterium aquilae DSM 44791]|uniref:LytR/CpsA/Psr regulator C-terminal domain-containing protein n=1 Tax=Corynebacterium aquilae DSM 44791 TaxID=1431546 RepID=A0A1L7CI77_9CORY|nr:hypothetical protein CAQU_11215 [Corynebacterium aquilae DSM 44791]
MSATGAAAPRVPLRGIAMILLAVAALLVAWGVWSMTRGDSDDVVRATATPSLTAPQGQKPAPANEQPQKPADDQAAPSPAQQPRPVEGQGQAAPAPAGGRDAAPAANVPTNAPVVVLNNSTVQGLAANVADRIRPNFEVAEVGNYPERPFPRSVAFYTPGNQVEEATAKAVARQLNIVAEPRPADLSDVPAGVLLILTQDMN